MRRYSGRNYTWTVDKFNVHSALMAGNEAPQLFDLSMFGYSALRTS